MIIGLLWCLCAVLCIAKRDRTNKRMERKGIALGGFFGFFGICGVLGQTYPIWINENAPEAYITKKSISGSHILTFLIGLLMLVLYVFMFVGTVIG